MVIYQISSFATLILTSKNTNERETVSQTNYRRSMLLSGDEPISPVPSGAVLPGISYFNKIYNMLDGTDLLEKPGRDIYTFRYSDTVQTWTSQYTYLVPVEFTAIPNLYPQCTKNTELSTMKETWSSSIITEKSTSKSSGFSISLPQIAAILAPVINAVYPGVGTTVSAITSSKPFNDASASIQNGNSRNIKTGRAKRREGYEMTYSLSAEVSLYESGSAWDQIIDFSFKSDFKSAINFLELNPTNKDMLEFIYKWGTHVISSARMGAMCEESVYLKALVEGYDYYDFYTYTKTKKSGILFWSTTSSTTTSMAQSGNYENQVFYEFNSIRCEGECKTSQSCGGMTGNGFWVKPVEYQLIPIWSIDGLMSIKLSEKFQLFVANIMKALLQCRIHHCNNNGICTLRDDIFNAQFVFSWDGLSFNQLIDYNRPCYCDDGYTGDLCQPTTTPPPTPRPTAKPSLCIIKTPWGDITVPCT